eukprot:1159814-Pelagomonas_calceolata.AAC.6
MGKPSASASRSALQGLRQVLHANVTARIHVCTSCDIHVTFKLLLPRALPLISILAERIQNAMQRCLPRASYSDRQLRTRPDWYEFPTSLCACTLDACHSRHRHKNLAHRSAVCLHAEPCLTLGEARTGVDQCTCLQEDDNITLAAAPRSLPSPHQQQCSLRLQPRSSNQAFDLTREAATRAWVPSLQHACDPRGRLQPPAQRLYTPGPPVGSWVCSQQLRVPACTQTRTSVGDVAKMRAPTEVAACSDRVCLHFCTQAKVQFNKQNQVACSTGRGMGN